MTDAGIAYVATLPDLKSLALYHVTITDVGLKHLASSACLENLEFAPQDATGVTIGAILALPHLRHLQLHEQYAEDWLARNLPELEQAQSLTSLTLIGILPPEEIQTLREKLPNCKFTVKKIDK